MCYNGGALDMDTCKCGCKKPYGGDSCQTREWLECKG